MDVIYLYLLTVPVFFAIDMVWLGFAARTFYRSHLGPLLRPNVNWAAAILFYLLYILGILIFATLPALEDRSLPQAAVLGGLFGFFAYATYDLTNLATVARWPLAVTLVDLAWGAAVAAATAYLTARFGPRNG